MGPIGHQMFAEQHDAQKSSFEKKSSQHFVSEQRARYVAGFRHKPGPVRAELETHGYARHYADSKGECKNLYPEKIGKFPVPVACQRESGAKVEQYPAQADGNGGKQDMKTDVGCKLQAREKQRIKFWHK